MAVTYPDPAFWPVAAMGHESLEIYGGASYDTDPGTPTCCDNGIDYHDWSVEETCGNGWIEGYYTYPNEPERKCVLVQFDCTGKHKIWHTVTDFGGTPSDPTLSYAWVYDISASLSQSIIAVGDTATLTMEYSPSNLPGYKKLILTGGVGAVEVLEGALTVISQADTSETWQLGSRFDPGLVTVKGISACYQATLSLQHTADGYTFLHPNYNGNSVTFKILDLDVNPTSGPIGTVVTLTLQPSGTGLLSDNTTVTITGHYVPQGYSPTSETTIAYPAEKVYYNPAAPDEVKIVVGEVQPDSLWLTANPQVYMANSGSLVGNVSLQMGATTLAWPRQFQLYSQDELGTLEGTTFTPVDPIATGQSLIAQVLIKDDGLGSAPDLLTITLQSCDVAGNAITAPPSEEYADPVLSVVVNKVSTGGIPGFHTYRSSTDEPIVPWGYKFPSDTSTNGNQYIYILDNGSVRIQY